MTQNTRELYILGKWGDVHDDDFLTLVSAWKNRDGSLTVINNCKLRPGTKLFLRPKREGAPEKAPDYSYSVRRSQIRIEDGEVEVLATRGE